MGKTYGGGNTGPKFKVVACSRMDSVKADADRIPAHIRHHGVLIDTSFKKGSNGTEADYWVVQGSRGRYYSLAAAKEIAEDIAKRKAAKADATPTIRQENGQWVITIDEGTNTSIFRLDVREYPTKAEALEYALSNPQYTNRKDSLPPLDRALAAADSLYAKALKTAHKDAERDLPGESSMDADEYEIRFTNPETGRSATFKYNTHRNAHQAVQEYKRNGWKVEQLSAPADAERDLPGSSTTEGNYGIDAE